MKLILIIAMLLLPACGERVVTVWAVPRPLPHTFCNDTPFPVYIGGKNVTAQTGIPVGIGVGIGPCFTMSDPLTAVYGVAPMLTWVRPLSRW
jgi:hypothetical protein